MRHQLTWKIGAPQSINVREDDLEEIPESSCQAGDCILPNLRIRLDLNAAVLDRHTWQMTTCTAHSR